MSYCRWSSDNFRCDLYCYESGRGFETHIAGARWRAWFRLFHFLTDRRMRFGKLPEHTIRIVRWNLSRLPHWLTHKRIRLDYAGMSFTDSTEAEMFERIRALGRLGYHIPEMRTPPK